jgi:hypothetical protein
MKTKVIRFEKSENPNRELCSKLTTTLINKNVLKIEKKDGYWNVYYEDKE